MLPQQEPDAGSKVQLWQAETSTKAGTDDSGIVSRLAQACLDSMSCLLRMTEQSEINQNGLKRGRAMLKLWANGHKVWNGELDRILERSRGLQHTLISVLNPLCKILSDGLRRHTVPGCYDADLACVLDNTAQIYSQTKWLLGRTTGDDSDSESESESESDNEEDIAFEQLLEDIKTHLNCLLDLSAALEYPAIDPQEHDEPSKPRVEQRAAHNYHADLILAKFPKAHIDLVESLGQTSWSRYQRMQQERELNTSTENHASIRADVERGAKSSLAISEFQDSGLGTSLPSAPPTRYAETVISFMTSIAGGKRTHIPPLPAQAKSGALFECDACGRHIRALNNREWRKHLYLDLKPYTCFFASCAYSSVPFSDRQLWSRHLELDHNLGLSWESLECPLCLERTDVGKSKILIHFARHMEEIALAALPRDVESEVESDEESHGHPGSTRSLSDRDDQLEEATTIEQKDGTTPEDLEVEENTLGQLSSKVDKPVVSVLEQAKQQFWDSHKDLSEEQLKQLWMTTASALPLDAFSTMRSSMSEREVALRRCKVLQLSDLSEDMGLVRIAPDSRDWWIVEVQSESVPEKELFSTFLTLENTFRKPHETLIVCKGRLGTDVSLSFQDVEGCALAWNILRRLQTEQAKVTKKLQEAVHHSRAPSSYWTMSERGDLRMYVSENGTDWAAIARKLGTKTSDMVREEYTRCVEAGDAALESMAQEADTRILVSVRNVEANQVDQNSTSSSGSMLPAGSPLSKNVHLELPKSISNLLNDRDVDLPSHTQQSLSRHSSSSALTNNYTRGELATVDDGNDIIRCICSSIDDDGNTVLCEMCGSRQHNICFYESAKYVPDVHLCLNCSPRSIDQNGAAQRRRQRRTRDQAGKDAIEVFDNTHFTLADRVPNSDQQIDLPKDLNHQLGSTEATGARAENAPVYYTRTGRISKAKEGSNLKTHNCDCGRSYTRAGNLRRHQKTHAQEDALVCEIDGRSKTFHTNNHADDSTPPSSSRRKPLVKSEKRTQSMTIWWAERKAFKKEQDEKNGVLPKSAISRPESTGSERGGRTSTGLAPAATTSTMPSEPPRPSSMHQHDHRPPPPEAYTAQSARNS